MALKPPPERAYIDWRRWLEDEKLFYGRPRHAPAHQCWAEATPCIVQPNRAVPFYGCIECGRSHYCQPPYRSCPRFMPVHATEAICPFSGRVVDMSESALVAGKYSEEVRLRTAESDMYQMQRERESNPFPYTLSESLERKASSTGDTNTRNQLFKQADHAREHAEARRDIRELERRRKRTAREAPLIDEGFDIFENMDTRRASPPNREALHEEHRIEQRLLQIAMDYGTSTDYDVDQSTTPPRKGRAAADDTDFTVAADEPVLALDLPSIGAASGSGAGGDDGFGFGDGDGDAEDDEPTGMHAANGNTVLLLQENAMEIAHDTQYIERYLDPVLRWVESHAKDFRGKKAPRPLDFVNVPASLFAGKRPASTLAASGGQPPNKKSRKEEKALMPGENYLFFQYQTPMLPWRILHLRDFTSIRRGNDACELVDFSGSAQELLNHQRQIMYAVHDFIRDVQKRASTHSITLPVPASVEDYTVRVDRGLLLFNWRQTGDKRINLTKYDQLIRAVVMIMSSVLSVDFCRPDSAGTVLPVWFADPFLEAAERNQLLYTPFPFASAETASPISRTRTQDFFETIRRLNFSPQWLNALFTPN